MRYFPVTLNFTNKHCLLVGGGEVAARKLKSLLKANAKVTVVAKDFSKEFYDVLSDNIAKRPVDLIHQAFSHEHLCDKDLVIAATNDKSVNTHIAEVARQKHIWVNVVDDLSLCTFIMPAVIDRSPLLIAISTGGVAPVLARKIREKIEWLLPANLGALLATLKKFRPHIKLRYADIKSKRSFSEWFIEKSIAGELEPQDDFEKTVEHFEYTSKEEGEVFLVGAGPGDPDLLTVKALKILQKADVVLHDALVSKDILELVRRDAQLIHVGKRARHHSVQQAEINQLLIEYAKKGLSVVRLKGGDPFIFGRGGEELEELVAANIKFQVVPGITAASGCASYAGIPLTHRDHAQSVMFITAYCKNSEETLDWTSIARKNQTVVVYMGLMRNEVLTQNLIANGRAASTPVAVIENGTSPSQRVVTGTLEKLPDLIEQNKIGSPGLIIIGEVTALAKKLNWFKPNTLIEHGASTADVGNIEIENIAA